MSTRMWFRLDEVLLLADHATTSPSRDVTGQHDHTGVPRPTLTRDSIAKEHLLTYHGLPGVRGDGGQRAAAERTWRHADTGPHSQPPAPDPARSRPAARRSRDHRHPPLQQARDGAEQGGHWLVVDTDPAKVATPDQFLILDHRDEIAPPDTRWVPSLRHRGRGLVRHLPGADRRRLHDLRQ